MIEEAEKQLEEDLKQKEALKYSPEPTADSLERVKPDLTEVIEPENSKKKTYMTKDPEGRIITKNRP
jgi:hypothetical protein